MTEETRIVPEAAGPESAGDAPTEVTEQPAPEAAAEAPAEQEVQAEAQEVTEAPTEAAPIEAAPQDETPAVVAEAPEEPQADAQAETSAPAPVAETQEESQEEAGKRKVVRLSVGQEVKGVVKRTTDFGAFVDIGAGRDGLIHISELSVGRVQKVTDVVQKGQEVTVWIKRLDRERNRISLTMIPPDAKTIRDLEEGEIIEGTVTRLVPYGAFVDIGVGTDALLHVREMSNGYVAKPEDVVKVGEKLEARIISVNRRRRRIDLSLKGLRDEPEPEEAEMDEAAAALGVDDGEELEDQFEDIEVLSPIELALKRAMEAEGIKVDTKKRRKGRKGKRARAIQEEIIQRTLEAMRD